MFQQKNFLKSPKSGGTCLLKKKFPNYESDPNNLNYFKNALCITWSCTMLTCSKTEIDKGNFNMILGCTCK